MERKTGKMIRLFKHIALLTFSLLIVGSTLNAQEDVIKIDVNAPEVVKKGDKFKVIFSVNREVINFKGPEFKGFEVLLGPIPRTMMSFNQSQTQISKSFESTFTYHLKATKTGKITIDQASLQMVNKKWLKSKPITIEVVTESTEGNSYGDIFIRNIVSDATPYKGQVITLEQKLYFRIPVSQISDVDMPLVTGFWKEELKFDKSSPKEEFFNGKVYKTVTLRKLVLIPQKTGTLEIKQIELKALITQMKKQKVRDFFGDIVEYEVPVSENYTIKSNPLLIKVLHLPKRNRPANFRGAVGKFDYEVEFIEAEKPEFENHEMIIRLSGKGNINMIEEPVFSFSDSVGHYLIDMQEKLDVNSSGMSGERVYRYSIIPLKNGTHKLSGLSFSYFDPLRKKFLTKNAPDFRFVTNHLEAETALTVSTTGSKVFIKQLRKVDNLTFLNQQFILNSNWHLAFILIPLLMLIGFIILRRRMIALRNDPENLKEIAVRIFAKKRLAKAEDYMKKGERNFFFDEMSEVLQGYLCNRFNIDAVDYSIDIAEARMSKVIKDRNELFNYIDNIKSCEYARFAPSSDKPQMEKIYAVSSRMIREIENHYQAK